MLPKINLSGCLQITRTLHKVHPQPHRRYSVISNILRNPNIGDVTEVKGWVKNLRVMKDVVFVDVSDGSSPNRFQVVIPKSLKTESLTYGSSVHATGKLSKTPKGQLELVANHIKVFGECVVLDGYPFNPRTTHPPDYLRQFLHFRPRTNYISAILRVRSAVTRYIHDFFYSRNYIQINTPIITSNDCEGAGEVFKIQPDNEETVKAMAQEGKDRDSVYFGTKSFLTVSGQLHLEAVCRGMGNVYTLGPTFRAENSKSRLHLSEFYMLEAEIAFCETLEDLQSVIEDLIKHVALEVWNNNEADLQIIEKSNKKPEWLNKEFITLTYDNAKSILEKKGLVVTDGVNKEQELTLVDYCAGIPVFITKWPKEMKSFYMKECEEDNSKVWALDLLSPVTGELAGGSLREDRVAALRARLPAERLQWYLDLRRHGNIPTAGFGLGLERLLQSLCAVPNIKDTLPFPRWPHNCHM